MKELRQEKLSGLCRVGQIGGNSFADFFQRFFASFLDLPHRNNREEFRNEHV